MAECRATQRRTLYLAALDDPDAVLSRQSGDLRVVRRRDINTGRKDVESNDCSVGYFDGAYAGTSLKSQ